MGTKLNAQVIIKNLQNMHEKSPPPTGGRGSSGARRRMELECQDGARLQGKGPHTVTGGPSDRTLAVARGAAGWRSSRW